VNELSCGVIENSEDGHLHELRETECDANHVALSDCDLEWSIKKPFVVSHNLVRISKRRHCSIVEDGITSENVRLLRGLVRALAESFLKLDLDY